MTDAAPDKEKRSHGVLWYSVCGGLLFYVTSYFAVCVIFMWWRLPERMPASFFVPFQLFYFPIQWLIKTAGLSEPFFELIKLIALALP